MAHLLSPCSAWADMQVLRLESFEGIKTLSADSPGQLGAFNRGAWHCRPIGPRLAAGSEVGWSADSQGDMTHSFWDLTQAPWSDARQKGMMGCWVRFEDLVGAGYYNSAVQANPAVVLQLTCGDDNAPFQTIGVTYDGRFLSRIDGSQWVAGETVKKSQWYWIQIEWVATPTSFSAKAYIQRMGGELRLLSVNNLQHANYQATRANVMNAPVSIQPGQAYMWRGRLGGATLARISGFGDGAPPPSLLSPEERQQQWFVNPAHGNDASDGLTPQTAWKSVAKINVESAHAGLLSPPEGGYEKGHSLVIDTSSKPLDLGSLQLEIRTTCLTISPPPGQTTVRIQAHKDISSGSATWQPVPSPHHSHVWMTTDGDSSDLKDIVVWENDRWLHHPTGRSAEEVMAELEANPGSFFSDGDTIFIHPFESTNPNADGKIYTRSRFRTEGGSAIKLLAPDLRVVGLSIRKTALARASDNDPYTSYGIQGEQNFGGVSLLKNCYVDYAGKHCIGFTDSNSHRDVTVDSCQVEQGTPYSNQTPWVDYNGLPEASGNCTTYRNCLNYRTTGVIGSTKGTSNFGTSYYAHNNGIGTQFEHIRFIGGVFSGQVGAAAGIHEFTFDGGTFGGGNVTAEKVTVTRCSLTQLPIGNAAPGGRLIARNNLCVFTEGVLNGANNAVIIGEVIWEGNTFDLRPFRISDNPYFSLFRRIGDLNFTFRNNIFISPTDRFFNVMSDTSFADALLFSDNLYQTSSERIIVHRFDDGNSRRQRSLSEWQAFGYDQRSRWVSDLDMTSTYVPSPDGPAAHGGIDLGAGTDFTGRVFESRSSIGAYEPAELYAAWRARHFLEEENSESNEDINADVDLDGIPNILEFASGTDPQMADGYPIFRGLNGTSSEGVNKFTVQLRRSLLASGLEWKLEISHDFKEWHPESIQPSSIVNTASRAGWEIVEYDLSNYLHSGQDRVFARFVPVIVE
ncbi:hypothetical protein [Prosthecobacter debontii]|nr:hypothetical protein [Prosthecobacter debontii]